MSEIILYPTETVYALGVNPFDRAAWHALCDLKGRHGDQTASWLLPTVEDIGFYGEITPAAEDYIKTYLPGPLTIVLKAKSHVPNDVQALDGTVSFRVSADPVTQAFIKEYMDIHNVPLTCTSANVHGQPTMGTPQDIASQFGDKVQLITQIIDDGPRFGRASTIVRCVGDRVTVLREGSIHLRLSESPISISANYVGSSWR